MRIKIYIYSFLRKFCCTYIDCTQGYVLSVIENMHRPKWEKIERWKTNFLSVSYLCVIYLKLGNCGKPPSGWWAMRSPLSANTYTIIMRLDRSLSLGGSTISLSRRDCVMCFAMQLTHTLIFTHTHTCHPTVCMCVYMCGKSSHILTRQEGSWGNLYTAKWPRESQSLWLWYIVSGQKSLVGCLTYCRWPRSVLSRIFYRVDCDSSAEVSWSIL